MGAGAAEPDPAPTEENTLSSRTESTWPAGHDAGEFASDMGRRSSKVASQVRHRYSYSGMAESVGHHRPCLTCFDEHTDCPVDIHDS